MSNPVQTIADVEGETITTRRARTRKQAVERAVRDGVALERADLRGADLNGLDLGDAEDKTPANLRGARLDNAHLKGVSLRGANLDGACMDNVSAQGADLSRVQGHGCEITNARLDGATLSYGDLSRSRIAHTELDETSASALTLNGAVLDSCCFDDGRLMRVDFRDATVHRTSFRNAAMRSTSSDADTLPDFTERAAIVGGSYKGADIGPEYGGLKRDRFAANVWRYGAWATTFLAFWTVGTGIEAGIDQLPKTSVEIGEGTTFALIAPGSVLASKIVAEMGLDVVMEKTYERARRAQIAVRDAIADLTHELGNTARIVGAVFQTSNNAMPLKAALATYGRDTDGHAKAAYRAITTDIGHVVLADADHMETAVHQLDMNAAGHRHSANDIVIVRMDENATPREDVPAAVRFHAEGGMTAAWLDTDTVDRVVRYEPTGEVAYEAGPAGIKGDDPVHSGEDVLKEFRDALLAEGGLSDLAYPPSTHRLVVGQTGAAAVRLKTTGRLDNPNGPALASPDGTRYWYANGVERTPPTGEPEASKENAPGIS